MCSAVMSEQDVEQWAEDAALGGASVEDDGGGYGVVNPYRLACRHTGGSQLLYRWTF